MWDSWKFTGWTATTAGDITIVTFVLEGNFEDSSLLEDSGDWPLCLWLLALTSLISAIKTLSDWQVCLMLYCVNAERPRNRKIILRTILPVKQWVDKHSNNKFDLHLISRRANVSLWLFIGFMFNYVKLLPAWTIVWSVCHTCSLFHKVTNK